MKSGRDRPPQEPTGAGRQADGNRQADKRGSDGHDRQEAGLTYREGRERQYQKHDSKQTLAVVMRCR
ncbi:hypothetical protein OU426_01015 [Frigidibacter sp. RF13]|uniref:hypothetical protein n=1 Tax=Frigidibacter sp. RF13 TaxID=2997340 RepID=UPI00226FA982|nr:hypothetical protein [Frigidibacter sp. RF13]MCY1125421.1 hypothetical protein [Frigidibacter sp. RF13]